MSPFPMFHVFAHNIDSLSWSQNRKKEKEKEKSFITGQRKCNIVSLGDHKNVLVVSGAAHDILLKSSLVPRP